MSRLVKLCSDIAREAHAGQKYDAADYYLAHVKPVAEMVRRLGYGVICQAGAYLHDVVEDTSLKLADLKAKGVPGDVLGIVDAVTKRPELTPEEYMRRVVAHERARVVKFADSSCNFASTVLLSASSPDAAYRRRLATYARNIAILQPILPLPPC